MTSPQRARARISLVRSYVPTAGQATPSRRSLDEATLLVIDTGPTAPPRGSLAASEQRVLELCAPGRLSVAEVAVYLQIPAAVTKVLAAGLADSGHLVAVNPVPAQRQDDQHQHLLERILDGLKAL